MRVVSGALIRDGRVLMGLRKREGMRPDLWELPGGKVEPDELPDVALAREWLEELGYPVRTGAFITSTLLNVEVSFVVELYVVVPNLDDPRHPGPQSLDHQRLAWVDPLCAVKWLPCSPAFYLHFSQLLPHVEATRRLLDCGAFLGAGCLSAKCLRCRPTREAFLDDLEKWTVPRTVS
jgi:8-oxo-dGTP diphosphatase